MDLWTRLALLLLFSGVPTLLVLLTYDGEGRPSSSVDHHHDHDHSQTMIQSRYASQELHTTSTHTRYATTALSSPKLPYKHSHHQQRQRQRRQQLSAIEDPTSTSSSQSNTSSLTFALVPKRANNPFFDVSGEGCQDAAERLQIQCQYIAPPGYDPTGALQVDLLHEMLDNHTISGHQALAGVAVSAVNASVLGPVFQRAFDLGIPVVTFDSDAPSTSRLAYIGTDNYFLGSQLAKALKKLHLSEPGTFAIVSMTPPNIMEREQGVRDHLASRDGWIEVATSPSDMNANSTLVVEQMFQFAETYPNLTAIIPVMGAGMRAPDNLWETFVKAHPDILLVVGDAMPNQLELLDRQNCQGLVGQLPYEMGVISVETLLSFATNPLFETEPFIGTNVLEHILIPLELPPRMVDHNLVGELRFVGYILFTLVAAMAVIFSIWTLVNRNVQLIRVAQPTFLVMVALGVLIMGSAILPLGYDDRGLEYFDNQGVAICMSPIWLVIVGFSICFSSLMAKLHRVMVVFHSGNSFTRAEAKERDVLIPLGVLLLVNCVILSIWTALDPLKYVRLFHDGVDGWDRPVSTYGTCRSDSGKYYYIVALGVLNGLVLLYANYSAYKARTIHQAFSESKYIAIVMASMLQAALSGVPILFVVQESPEASYMVSVFMIFIVCSVILLLVFAPKIVLFEQFKNEPDNVQRARISNAIQQSVPLWQRMQRMPARVILDTGRVEKDDAQEDEETGELTAGAHGENDNDTREEKEAAPEE